MSFILSLLFGMVMSISCDWLHFCFLARVLKCIVVKNHSYSTASCTRFIQQKENIYQLYKLIRVVCIVPLFSFAKLCGYESAGVIYLQNAER